MQDRDVASAGSTCNRFSPLINANNAKDAKALCGRSNCMIDGVHDVNGPIYSPQMNTDVFILSLLHTQKPHSFDICIKNYGPQKTRIRQKYKYKALTLFASFAFFADKLDIH
jgi:hypothetical protein